jgi:hypothetical protein
LSSALYEQKALISKLHHPFLLTTKSNIRNYALKKILRDFPHIILKIELRPCGIKNKFNFRIQPADGYADGFAGT